MIRLCKMLFCTGREPYRFGSGLYLNWIVSSSNKSRGNWCIRVVIVSGGGCLMGADLLPTTPLGKGVCIMVPPSSILTTYLASQCIGWVPRQGSFQLWFGAWIMFRLQYHSTMELRFKYKLLRNWSSGHYLPFWLLFNFLILASV
jgi:hypothetical protein